MFYYRKANLTLKQNQFDLVLSVIRTQDRFSMFLFNIRVPLHAPKILQRTSQPFSNFPTNPKLVDQPKTV